MACGGRELIAAQYVKPYVKTNKNDFNDAEANCEASQRPGMRFVLPETAEQQQMQARHRVRELIDQFRERLRVLDQDIAQQENGFAAWIGLVPKQHSSGGKTVLQGIRKRGNPYLRKLLIHGARDGAHGG